MPPAEHDKTGGQYLVDGSFGLCLAVAAFVQRLSRTVERQRTTCIVDVKVEPEVKRDKFASYNIKYIEQILHDSRSIEARNDKVRIEQVWKNMTRGARPQDLSIIETLQTGKVAVVGNKEFIIVFPNVSICNIVMRRKFKDVAIRIFNMYHDGLSYKKRILKN